MAKTEMELFAWTPAEEMRSFARANSTFVVDISCRMARFKLAKSSVTQPRLYPACVSCTRRETSRLTPAHLLISIKVKPNALLRC